MLGFGPNRLGLGFGDGPVILALGPESKIDAYHISQRKKLKGWGDLKAA